MKKNKNKIIELFIIFIITFIFSLIFKEPTNDDIWNYGFAYNIATGLIPYKDFNMVTTPLFPTINALFLKLFGLKIYVSYLVNALICTIIFYFLKKNNKKSYYLTYGILLSIASPNYNILSLLLLLIIIELEKKDNKDLLIGVVLGLTFLTKQSIGIYLCIPSLFTFNIKKISKRILGFIIAIIPTTIYLIYTNSFYDFINYCFLGITEFGTKNNLVLIIPMIILILSLILLIHEYLKTKNISIIYLICFFGVSYPIMDSYHVVIPFIPTFNYFISKLQLNKKIIMSTFTMVIIIISLYNLYEYSCKEKYMLPNVTIQYKYNKLNNNTAKEIRYLASKLKNSDKNTFLINSSGYILKLEANIPINKYDMLLNGNIGKNGTNRIINDFNKICKKDKCSFWVNNSNYETKEYNQYNKELHEYVVNNYIKDEDMLGFTIYRNYKK